THELRRRELSVFRGALRVYQPGLTLEADPLRHPLVLPHRLSLADNRYAMAQVMAAGTVKDWRPDGAIPLLRDERAVAYDSRRRQTLADLGTHSEAKIEEWQRIAQEYADENSVLGMRVQDLEQDILALEAKVAALRHGLDARSVPTQQEGALDVQ